MDQRLKFSLQSVLMTYSFVSTTVVTCFFIVESITIKLIPLIPFGNPDSVAKLSFHTVPNVTVNFVLTTTWTTSLV